VLPSSGAGAPPSTAGGRGKDARPSLLPPAGEGAEQSEADEGKLACLVGSDAAYAEGAVEVAQSLVASGHTVWLAGKPGEMEAALGEAGVSRFIFAGCDVVEALTAALEER
jgi:hypothetical protein